MITTNLRRIWMILIPFILLLTLCNCGFEQAASYKDASEYGVNPDNDGLMNSRNLQALIDDLSVSGGTIYIPAGEYEFAQNGTQTIGAHCVKMRSNIHIIGDGDATVLKPVGESKYGLDMFYFNDYLDTNQPIYLENCTFEGFTVDASDTFCEIYTSAGKGFMFNLFRNCHWKNVIVMNTDATGFGVDCPIDSSLDNCTAMNCGKAATSENGGASGFGIGFGYAENESILIKNCTAYDNRKFGYFFEHQGRFDPKRYPAVGAEQLMVSDCVSEGNLFNYGGIHAANAVYDHCKSSYALQYGFYFENSFDCKIENCSSFGEKEASFVIGQLSSQWRLPSIGNISIQQCISHDVPYGCELVNAVPLFPLMDVTIMDCVFENAAVNPVHTYGAICQLTLLGNQSDNGENYFDSEIEHLVNTGNSWNQ